MVDATNRPNPTSATVNQFNVVTNLNAIGWCELITDPTAKSYCQEPIKKDRVGHRK